MKVYVSSTFVDLKEHRAAAIRILRQLGHDVLAMENYVADSAIPLYRVLEDVKVCDAYVGIYAWRYGYIPGLNDGDPAATVAVPEGLDLPAASEYGTKSITEWEYLQAREDHKRPILAFLLDEGVSWPPQLIDGFSRNTSNDRILALRQQLQRERIVAYFKSPEDLEARVSAAITMVNMSRQVAINLLDPASSTPDGVEQVSSGNAVKDSAKVSFINAIVQLQAVRVVRIDIATDWWSTRLYLLACLAERCTQIQRILIVQDEDFVGLLSTFATKSSLAHVHPALAEFEKEMAARDKWEVDPPREAEEMLRIWDTLLPLEKERDIKRPVTQASLKWWFSDSLVGHGLRIKDLSNATAFDLARLLDFPIDYVPVITANKTVKVVDKHVLNAELARNYLDDLLKSSGVLPRK